MNDSAASVEPAEGSRFGLSRILGWLAWAAVTALYAVHVINAVGNFTGMREIAQSLDAALSPTGWFWLLLGVLLPVVVFAMALIFGRGRGSAMRVFLLVTGLAVLAAYQLEILHLVPQWTFFAV